MLIAKENHLGPQILTYVLRHSKNKEDEALYNLIKIKIDSKSHLPLTETESMLLKKRIKQTFILCR